MTNPFDQSSLTEIAERLVAAALRHGADAADAVAVRGISQSIDVRDGSVEESQRSEGDNVGLRAFVGRRQAVVSTNDLSAKGVGVDAAYDAIASTLPKGAARWPMQRDQGRCFIQVEAAVVDRMRAMRRPGESYSDVILRLVKLEGSRAS